MSSPITDEIVALEDALEKRDAKIERQREILEHARAIVSEAIARKIWDADRLDELYYRETLDDIDTMLDESP